MRLHAVNHTTGIPKAVLFRVLEESYQRSVAPEASRLQKTGPRPGLCLWRALSLPLLYDIIQQAQLTHRSIFWIWQRRGERSGAGQSLQTVHQRVFEERCALWGVQSGPWNWNVVTSRKSTRLKELLIEADVIFVNNERFGPAFESDTGPDVQQPQGKSTRNHIAGLLGCQFTARSPIETSSRRISYLLHYQTYLPPWGCHLDIQGAKLFLFMYIESIGVSIRELGVVKR
ncbi:hypothetical protein R3P38DRAFT_2779681 [Favolaschia claudopus]|uniref:DOT1 domain-containing protein n=1 Tax=Favolaschia claudopus TaxID=2862362 RepID=A0AAW0BDI7_9AGAR